ncbi:MAG: hypothetical protein K6F86_00990 [Lachnospiraceae bacterium]|nr:hypothetical protein [Lachnospiraceae bacterium]
MSPKYGKDIKDGSYNISVKSSSEMFNIENCTLTVKDSKMTADMEMGGKGYLYVFPGTPEEAVKAEEKDLIKFTEKGGKHVFTIPVEALDKECDCAAFSKKKEKWYDRTLVFESSALPLSAFKDGVIKTAESLGLKDGEYKVDVALSGGSGKASVTSPAKLTVKDKKAVASIEWSSPNYDYMIVNGEKYLPVNKSGNSVFEIPVAAFDEKINVTADTTAMSKPHEIEYSLKFDSGSVK